MQIGVVALDDASRPGELVNTLAPRAPLAVPIVLAITAMLALAVAVVTWLVVPPSATLIFEYRRTGNRINVGLWMMAIAPFLPVIMLPWTLRRHELTWGFTQRRRANTRAAIALCVMALGFQVYFAGAFLHYW